MTKDQAFMLIRLKYTEEIRDTPTAATTLHYREACEQFPVVMAVALQLFANMKNL